MEEICIQIPDIPIPDGDGCVESHPSRLHMYRHVSRLYRYLVYKACLIPSLSGVSVIMFASSYCFAPNPPFRVSLALMDKA